MQVTKSVSTIEEVEFDDVGRRNRRILWIVSVGIAVILATITAEAKPQGDVHGEVLANFGIVQIIKVQPASHSEVGP
ncbi:MAG: hypothetical protein ACYCY6_00860 [Minisyncoccota bacterium]